MNNVLIACGLQRAYFHSTGTRYLGERAEVLKVRLVEYLKSVPKDTVIFYVREIHQTNDTFFLNSKSYALVGTPDIEILEIFKPYAKFIVNTTRYSALYRTPLESELSKLSPKTVTVIGVETHTNVLFTVEESRNMGYEVVVPEPLTCSEDDYLHTAAINLLSNTLSVRVT
jgi:nicotinamidase-related amidase